MSFHIYQSLCLTHFYNEGTIWAMFTVKEAIGNSGDMIKTVISL